MSRLRKRGLATGERGARDRIETVDTLVQGNVDSSLKEYIVKI